MPPVEATPIQEPAQAAPQERQEADAPTTIASATEGLAAVPGLFVTYPDARRGKLWLELPAPAIRPAGADMRAVRAWHRMTDPAHWRHEPHHVPPHA